MLFNSIEFLIFFPLVTGFYFVIPHHWRWALLLMASCVFYMCFIPAYILILFFLIIIDYFMGIYIETSSGARRRMFLIVSILSTCLVLFVFKYFNFFSSSFSELAQFWGFNYPAKVLGLVLPIGLSFHTFQSLSYVIEVYRGHQKAERHFGIYALYVMFYPQLVAGPIERPQNLLHQFREKHYFDYDRVTDGLKLMAWGMFKKVVIANRLAIFVNQVYGAPMTYHGPAFVIATVFFAFQIYCDFSGYSDIAIGAAQVMGFKLMDNFNRPYFSKSVAEFWKRWHISLSSWFRDYLYISLGGNRCVKWRWQFNLFITFLVSGLWHGANWTYIIWGALNGFYLIFGIWTSEFKNGIIESLGLDKHQRVLKLVQVTITFSLICFAWIFFRANNIQDAYYIASHLFHGWVAFLGGFKQYGKLLFYHEFGLRTRWFLINAGLLIFLVSVHLVQRHNSIRHMFRNKPAWFRWSFYYLMLLGMIFLGNYGRNAFIYFQF